MRHLDLCSGIGGFTLAAQGAGFQTIGFAETESYCCKVLARHWPEVRNYGDLRTADFSHLRGHISVLSAGVPCQTASLAGKRRGASDDRWLWPAVLDVVESVRPAWCIFENPDGILSLGEFSGILLRLAEIGYEIRMFSVPANAVGAKHLRYRVFIVCHSALANPGGGRFGRTDQGQVEQPRRTKAFGTSEVVADAECERRERRSDGRRAAAGTGASIEPERAGGHTQALADADSAGLEELQSRESGQFQTVIGSCVPDGFGLTQSPLCGRADGVRNRVHRLKALGNAVVPAQAYPFFKAIRETERWNGKHTGT